MSEYFYELSLEVGGSIAWSGAATIAGAGSLAVPGTAIALASAQRAGISVISVGATRQVNGAIGIAGTAAVSVSAQVAASRATLAPVGSVTTAATLIDRQAGATIAGAGTPGVAASHTPAGAATIAGAGTVATLALGVAQQSGSAGISGAATVSIAASHTPAGILAISGAATLTVDGETTAQQAAVTISGVVTIGGSAGPFSASFSRDFGPRVEFNTSATVRAQAAIGIAAAGSVTGSALARAQATIGIGGQGAARVAGTGGTVGASALVAGATTVATIGAAKMLLTQQVIAGTGSIGVAATVIDRQAKVSIAGVGSFGSNATRAAMSVLARVSGVVSVKANAGVLRTADPTFAVVFHVGIDAKLGTAQGVDIPTEVEFDALAAEVAALETTGVSSVIYAGQPFYCVEITAGRGGTSVFTPTRGFGTRPRGAITRRTSIVTSMTTILASDMGYRTAPLDPDGVVPYPPLVQTAFTLSRHINIDPTQNGVGASWGSVVLSNASRAFDGIAAAWNNDGRDLVIRRGVKTFDPDRGYYTDPPISKLSTIFQGLSTQWMLDATSLSVPLIDVAYWLSRPYQAGYFGGTGGYDGTATLRGVPVPRTRGGTIHAPVRNISPTLIDPANRIYQFSDARGFLVRVFENGGAVFAFAGDTTNLYAGSTPPGNYRTDNSRSLFQMGSVPVGQITVDVTGEFPVAGPVINAAQIIYYMMTEDCLVPGQYVDIGSFNEIALGSGTGPTRAGIDRGFGTHPRGALARRTVVPSPAEGAAATAGVYFDSSSSTETGLTAIDRVLNSIGGHIVPTRSGLLRLFLLRALDSKARVVGRFDPSVLVGLTPQPMPSNLLPMPYRFRVGYAHNYTVQSMVGSALATDEQRQFMPLADRFATWISPGVQASNVRPNDPNPVGGALLEFESAQGVANAHGALWGTRRRVYNAEMPVALALQYELGDVVSTVYPMDDLSGGKLGQIIGEDFVSTGGTSTLQILV